ncbi:MAG: hypothetical protein WC342_00130 [Methanoregula sp.]|jgi:hypothetical protein
MNRTVLSAFVGVLLAACLCAGCTSGPSPENASADISLPDINTGIVAISPAATGHVSFTLEEAATAVYGAASLNNTSAAQVQIMYIRGEQVSIDGAAGRWLFGVRMENSTKMFSVSPAGVKEIPWGVGLPTQAIDLNRVLSPSAAIVRACPECTVANSTVQSAISSDGIKLELKNGGYTVTLPDSFSPRVRSVDAETGALTEIP